MTKDCFAALTALVARLSDLQAGYREASDRVSDPMKVALLSHLFGTHLAHLVRITEALQGRGLGSPAADQAAALSGKSFGHIGTFFAEADETVLPGILDAEARIVADYGRAIAAVMTDDMALRALLTEQCRAVQSRIDMLRGLLPRQDADAEFNPQVRRIAGTRADA